MRPLSPSAPRRLRPLGIAVTILAVAAGLVGTPVTAPAAGAAEPGEYSDPEWWPLRGTNLVGCAHNSTGPTCNGHHSVWAIDAEGPEGQEVYAAGAGQAFVHSDSSACSGFGKAVEIDHDGRWSVYAHLSSIEITDGQWVDENTVIGRLGHTGSVSGCSYDHLHYEEGPDNTWWTGSLDPGPTKACVDGELVTYPEAWGRSSWDGLEGHEHHATNDGTGCEAADPRPELLVNGGFESGMTGWTEVSGSDANRTRTVPLPYDGAKSLRVDGNGSWSRVHQTVPGSLARGDSFVAEVMVRAVTGTQRGRLSVLGMGGGVERAKTTFTVGTDWQIVRVPITLAQDRTRLRIELLARPGNRLLFDAASLRGSLLTNAGFESGTTGWTQMSGSDANRTRTVPLPHDGAKSLRVDGNGSWSRVHQTVPGSLARGDSFVAEVMVRAVTGTQRGRLSVLGMGGGVERANTTFTVGTDWQIVRVPITLTRDRTRLRIELLARSGNRLLFDAASLRGSLLTNAGFESGTTGWTEMSGSDANRTRTVPLPHDGAKSLRVDGNGSWSRVHQTVPGSLARGDSFVAEVMVRAVTGTQRGRLSVLGLGGGVERARTTFTVGTDWQIVRVPITLKQDRTRLRIELLARAGNRLLFDATSIS